MQSPVIAIASGKGGTGKTFLAVNLALVADERVGLLDCDAEEPNCHLFLRPEWAPAEEVPVTIPTIDPRRCNRCGACVKACRFNALAILGSAPLHFPELCHNCGNCARACPTGAIGKSLRPIGTIQKGFRGKVLFVQGKLNVGEARCTPVIEEVKANAPEGIPTIVDAPPGTACPAVTTVQGVDYLVLVTEPTPFGLNDLRLAVEMARVLGRKVGVVVNRDGHGTRDVAAYCRQENLPLLATIPFRRKVAELVARGGIAVNECPEMATIIGQLWERIKGEATGCSRS